MDAIDLRVVNKSNNKLPEYKTKGSSGMDVRAFLESPLILRPGDIKLISTGLYFNIPEGYEIQIRSRSGLSLEGIVVINSPATIDSDYTGELKVILTNLGSKDFKISNGDRIAQIVVSRYTISHLVEINEINEVTERGSGGLGHTGIK